MSNRGVVLGVMTAGLLAVLAAPVLAEGTATSQPTSQPGASPKAVVERLCQVMMSDDLSALPALVHPEQRKVAEVMFGAVDKMMKKAAEVATAADEKFGKEVGDKIRESKKDETPSAKFKALGIYKDGKIDWTKIKIVENGDEAAVTLANEHEKPMDLARVDGKWYLVLEKGDRAKEMEKNLEMVKGFMAMAVEDLNKTIEAVKAGKMTKEELLAKFVRPAPGPAPMDPGKGE